MKLFIVFDVESIGLHGDAFAVGCVVIDESGTVFDEILIVSDQSKCAGTPDNHDWCKKNIPYLDDFKPVVRVSSQREMRDFFWATWKIWEKDGALLIADCSWPVEARFLAKCVDDYPESREWEGPYPLHDLASILLAHGLDPLKKNERLPDELPEHNPLCDARQSARILIETLKNARKEEQC